MSTTGKPFLVFAGTGDIVSGNVLRILHAQRFLVVELETSEQAVLPFGELVLSAGETTESRVDGLVLPEGEDEGTLLNLRVIDAYGDGFKGRRILVSEKAVDERIFHRVLDRKTAESDVVPTNVVPAEVLTLARQRHSLGHVVRGVVVGDAPGGGKRVDIGNFVAVLSREDMGTTRPDSFRKGVAVKVKFKDVSEKGITLTRKGVA